MYCGRSRWVARQEYVGVGVRSGSGVVLLSYLHCFLPCLVDPLLLDVARGPSSDRELGGSQLKKTPCNLHVIES